ncbi:hypothetical protein CGSHi6P18H1_09140 [Haemophilus influenzae 6P18H1]|nr:hypothetical protein CGSHi6P18H1_09140 [Haemophilus influenzae 6P18H1]
MNGNRIISGAKPVEKFRVDILLITKTAIQEIAPLKISN